MATRYKVGDRVTVRESQAHDSMTSGKSGTVQSVGTEALAIKFDGIAEVHKWYVDDEVRPATGGTGR